jgi:hypothetical protein
MKNVICLSVLLSAGVASAAPVVSADVTDIGGGLYSSVISLSDGSSTGSWAANLTVTGANGAQINQVTAFGAVTINTESDANTYQGIVGSGYTKATDTWYYNSIFTTVLPAGIVPGANSFQAHVGTAAGVNWGEVTMLHIVSTEGVLNYSGTIGRASQNYSPSGSITIPEPASLALAATGLLLAGRRRRSA